MATNKACACRCSEPLGREIAVAPAPRAVSHPEWERKVGRVTSLLRGWLWETDTHHRFVYMSDSVMEFAGRRPEWHYGKTREELGNQPYDGARYAKFRSALAAHRPFDPIEFRREQDGQVVWMRTTGQPIFDGFGRFLGYHGIAYEVRAEIAAQESKLRSMQVLSDSLQLLEDAIRELPYGVGVFDKHRRLVCGNPAYYASQGLDPEQFPPGTGITDILQHLRERGEYFGPTVDQIVDGQVELIADGTWHKFERTRRNGERIESTCAPLEGGSFMISLLNTTEKVELKWRLAQALRELKQRNWELDHARQLVDVLNTIGCRQQCSARR